MINNRVHKFNIEHTLLKILPAGTPSTWVDSLRRQLKLGQLRPRLPTVFDNLLLLPAVQSLSSNPAHQHQVATNHSILVSCQL